MLQNVLGLTFSWNCGYVSVTCLDKAMFNKLWDVDKLYQNDFWDLDEAINNIPGDLSQLHC